MSSDVTVPVIARGHRRGNPGLRSLWWASGCSLTGSEAYDATLLMLTTSAYGAVISVGGLALALRITPVVLTPLAAAVLDHRPSRRAARVRAITLVSAALVASFTAVLHSAPSAHALLYVLIALIAALDAIFLAGVRAGLPRLFTADDPAHSQLLAKANSSLIVQWAALQIIVPVITIAIMSLVSLTIILVVDAISFIGSYFLLSRFVAEVERSYIANDAPAPLQRHYVSDLRQGFSVGLRDRVTRTVLVTAAITQGVMFTFLLALPTIAAACQLPRWSVGLSLCLLATGALIGGRISRKCSIERSLLRLLLLDPIMRLASLVLLLFAHVAVAAFLACLLIGLPAGFSNVARTTLIQQRFTDALLGRVITLAGVSNQILMPLLPLMWQFILNHRGFDTALMALIAELSGAAVIMIVVYRYATHRPRSET